MITNALSISPWGAGLVHTDIGSDDGLAQHDLHIPAHTRPGQQSEAAQRQAACRPLQEYKRKSCVITYHPSGCPVHQQASKPARELRAHSVKYAHKFVPTRRVIELHFLKQVTPHSQALELGRVPSTYAIECIGRAMLALCLERVLLLGGSPWGSAAPVFIIFSGWGHACLSLMCCARTGRACCRSWPRPNSGCPWEATSGDLINLQFRPKTKFKPKLRAQRNDVSIISCDDLGTEKGVLYTLWQARAINPQDPH
eukprot:1157180-Pelagomonas_calceolata.AAC.8